MTNPLLSALNEAGEGRARGFGKFMADLAQPTPATRWLERAGKQLRETKEAE